LTTYAFDNVIDIHATQNRLDASETIVFLSQRADLLRLPHDEPQESLLLGASHRGSACYLAAVRRVALRRLRQRRLQRRLQRIRSSVSMANDCRDAGRSQRPDQVIGNIVALGAVLLGWHLTSSPRSRQKTRSLQCPSDTKGFRSN
jgi:hypothetical protein